MGKYVTRLKLIAMAILIFFDCLANCALSRSKGSWNYTLSGESWKKRDRKYLRWCWRAIDAVFGEGHCQRQSERESAEGGVWKALANDWRATQSSAVRASVR